MSIAPKAQLLRGRVLNFVDEPQAHDDRSAISYREDGAILIEDGKISAVDDFATLNNQVVENCSIIDHRPHLLLAGFIDAHIHFPQIQVVASWGTELLDWLERFTFPAEAQFADPAQATAMAEQFCDMLIAHGTTTALAFGSVHKTSIEALFRAASNRDMRMLGGKVMMDRNAPETVLDDPQSGYDDSLALIQQWHGKGRIGYAISPRFAITSSEAQLAAAGALAQQYSDCLVQTHLSENHDEIALTAKLFPDCDDYFAVYEKYGLVGPKSLFGHCLHLSERERAAMADSGSVAVFCPTSNLFLGSGLFDEVGLRKRGVRRAIATDIGGGTSYSMLRTLDEGYKVLSLRGQKLEALRAFYWATLGNARALSLADRIGNLAPGSDADIVVLDAAATPAMALRKSQVETLEDELFLLQTMGDDRSVRQVYVAGRAMLPLIGSMAPDGRVL